MEATISIDGHPLPGWERRPVALTPDARQRLELWPERDLAAADLGFRAGFLRAARVELRVVSDGAVVAGDEAVLDVCDVRTFGTLYARLVDRLVKPDTRRQARQARVADPGVRYHPWYPVLTIGGDKAALYTEAVVADIVGKEYHLTDPAWLLRVGVYLELLTCIGIVEAVRPDVGDLLTPDEREAYETSEVFAEIRERINPEGWREVWGKRRISFPGFGSPRLGPVSALNLMRKRDATLRFLHVHHEDLKHAIELAGPNHVNSQETWQRVFRDAERAVMRQAGRPSPSSASCPAPARELVLWQRLGFAGQQGLYPTACNQYRASMNAVADWAKAHGLMDHAGPECVPVESSLLDALVRDPPRVAVLQRQDGLGPRLTVTEPAAAAEPTTEEIERLLAEVPIFRMLSPADVHALALGTRPLLLGPDPALRDRGPRGDVAVPRRRGRGRGAAAPERRHRLARRDDGPRRGGRGDGAPHRGAARRDRQVRGRDRRVRDRPGAVRAAAARPSRVAGGAGRHHGGAARPPPGPHGGGGRRLLAAPAGPDDTELLRRPRPPELLSDVSRASAGGSLRGPSPTAGRRRRRS